MTKNITDEYANWIYAREKQPPEKERIKALSDETQKIFTELCNLQRDGIIEKYRKKINLLKRWS